VHPIDLLAVVLAVGLAALAYAYLFRRSPVPRPVDPLLGARVTVVFPLDRPWKSEFAKRGDKVQLEEYLTADVAETRDDGGRRTATLVVRQREAQTPEALTLFRSGVRVGSELRMNDQTRETRVEVLDVALAGGAR
jgi:hypothetical protein